MRNNSFKILVLSLVFILSFTTLASPTITFASKNNFVDTNSMNILTATDNSMNIITQTDNKVVYEIEQDGEKLRYEEDIEYFATSTVIQTKVYKIVEGDLSKLIDSFTTEIINNDSQEPINIIQSGVAIPLIFPEIELSELPDMSTFAYEYWITLSFLTEFGYRKDYATGKAQARYSTMLRSDLSISNKNFDAFASEIDSLKTWERALVFDATIIGLLEAGMQLKNGLTWAAILNLGKKFFVPVNTLYNAYNWLLDYNSANSRFSTLGGTLTRVCHYSC